jgi:uridine kinase
MKERVLLENINRRASQSPKEMISEAENSYHAKISEITDELLSDSFRSVGKRIVFIAGPSGSGKTTTANLLSDSLNRRGYKSGVISLDMFYHDHSKFPKKADGSYDYENITAIDCEEIRNCIKCVLSGREYKLQKYDFSTQSRNGEYSIISAGSDGFVIVEGIHGLNPVLIEGIDAKKIYRIFVSVSNGISIDGVTEAVTGKDLRFVRRLSRDLLYRGAHADKTISMWEDVLEGENKYLYPYKELADKKLNTFHSFEAGVLKPFVFRALEGCTADFNMIGGLLKRTTEFFKLVTEIPEELVPASSLIREFIGDGIYESLY